DKNPAPRQSLGAPPTSSPSQTDDPFPFVVSVKGLLGPAADNRKGKMSYSRHFLRQDCGAPCFIGVLHEPCTGGRIAADRRGRPIA
ncbi:hypothetical protein, partial [Gemmobacter serpentinus]|uniref:hypothetical protein n=1 Tax=Gemmobacter serpentinus TaxID=2652247 RepID=UPI001CF6BC0C